MLHLLILMVLIAGQAQPHQLDIDPDSLPDITAPEGALGLSSSIYRTYGTIHGTVYLPNKEQTPGAIDPELTKTKLCDKKFHTGTVRKVTQKMKVTSCKSYEQMENCPGQGYELDHLISIELGGSNDPSNLWPQPADEEGFVVGYHTKDVVENRAHAAVCRGEITLKEAQEGIADDWYAWGLAHEFVK